MKLVNNKYFPYAIILLILIFTFKNCDNKNSKIADLKTELSIDSLDFTTRLNSKNRVISEQEIKRVSDKKTMKRLVEEVEGVKGINRQLRVSSRTTIKDVRTNPVRPVRVVHDTFTIDNTNKIAHLLKLPQSYSMENEWIGIKYSIDTLGKSIVDFAEFISKPTITFGYKDEGFIKNIFKKDIPIVTYEDKNPYNKVEGLQNLEFNKKKKWYQKKGYYFAAGVFAGFYGATR